MRQHGCTYGVAVFSRTDTPEYVEHEVPFGDLDELALVCATPLRNLTLEKVVLHRAGPAQHRNSVTLGFIAAGEAPVPVAREEETQTYPV